MSMERRKKVCTDVRKCWKLEWPLPFFLQNPLTGASRLFTSLIIIQDL